MTMQELDALPGDEETVDSVTRGLGTGLRALAEAYTWATADELTLAELEVAELEADGLWADSRED